MIFDTSLGLLADMAETTPGTVRGALTRLEDAGFISQVKLAGTTRSITLSPLLCPGTAPLTETLSAKSVPWLGQRASVPFEEVRASWNEMAAKTKRVPAMRKMSEQRKAKLRLRWKEWSEVGDPWVVWESLMAAVLRSPLLRGDSRGWRVDLTFVIRSEETWTAMLDGKYARDFGESETEEDMSVLFPDALVKKTRPPAEVSTPKSRQSLLDEFRERF